MYLLGGHTGGAAVSTVYTAPINEDGTLGTWTTATSLPVALHASQAIVTNSRVYLLGGDAVSTVYTAPILGGYNNYLDKTFYAPNVDSTKFYIPDYRDTLTNKGRKYYIKAKL